MTQSETEHDRKVVEFWKKFSIYDLDFTKNNDDELPFKPTAVLSKAPPNHPVKKSIYSISSLDFTT